MRAFPQDLIKEILVLVPLKSFLRFKCVSRSFCSAIESQHFIKSRFKRSSGMLIELQESGDDIRAFEFNHDFQRELVLVQPRCFWRQHLGYSHCRGLVLMHILHSEFSPQNPSVREHKYSLWNPSTGEYRVLPDLALRCTRDSGYSFGLGYDSTADDYKAVVLTEGEGFDSPVWIFSLKSNCWRMIQDVDNAYFPLGVFTGGNRDGFVDGALYFACGGEDEDEDEDEEAYMIVAFDVAKETFSPVKKPDCRPFFDGNIHFNVIGGCLAVTFFYNGVEEDGIDQVDTYIQKKGANEFSWTRLYNVTEDTFGEEVFGYFSEGKPSYSREGDKVFFPGNGKLFSYDYKKEHLQETEIEISNNHLDLLCCTECLVSLHPYGRLPL